MVDDLRELILVFNTQPNVRAFSRTVRQTESLQTDDAYRIRYNGDGPRAFFDSFEDHPRVFVPIPNDPQGRSSSAAGAYQITATTYDYLKARHAGVTNFTPETQDGLFVGCLLKRNALADVIAGRFADAVAKCRLEWTSLPGAGESRSSWTTVKAQDVFVQYGGALSTPAQPTSSEEPMTPLIAPFASNVLPGLLGTVFQLFAGKAQSKVEKLTGAAPEVAREFLNSFTQQLGLVTGTPVTNDPQAIQAVNTIVNAPPEARATAVAKLEAYVDDYFAKLSPMLDKVAEYDKRTREVSDESHDKAARRADSPEGWKLRWVQASFTQKMLAVAAVVIAVLIAVMTISLVWIPDAASAAILNLIGQLVILLVGVITMVANTFRDQNGFSFGGTADNNAASIARTEIEAARRGVK